MTRPLRDFTVWGMALAGVVILAAGCQSAHKYVTGPGLMPAATSSPTPAAAPDNGREGPSTAPAGTPSVAVQTAAPTADPAQPTPHADNKATQTLSNTAHPDDKAPAVTPLAGPVISYSSDAPHLMGLALTDTKQHLLEMYGTPAQTYSMDDSSDPLTVLDYDTFSVGFNPQGKLVFVDVASSDADPGLNGLRLGQKAEDAQKALGNPSSTNPYVITYETKTTVLKLDIDPKTKTIVSIKLFGKGN